MRAVKAAALAEVQLEVMKLSSIVDVYVVEIKTRPDGEYRGIKMIALQGKETCRVPVR